jgi:hypothetical protein
MGRDRFGPNLRIGSDVGESEYAASMRKKTQQVGLNGTDAARPFYAVVV